MNRSSTILLLCCSLSACSLGKDVNAAKMKVAHFHQLLNAGNVDQIAAQADPAMRWPAKGPSFKEYLLAVHRKLGFCGAWRLKNYFEQIGPGGSVRVLAATHCDADDAEESFLFSRDLRLRGYAVNSRVLVVS
jgi:hypothetical protein